MEKIAKQKKCKAIGCGKLFTPVRPLQQVCSHVCAMTIARHNGARKQANEATKQRQELREAKIKAKTRGQWVKEAQAEFNKFIRWRDKYLPCVSCGRIHQGQWHAGHYMPTSTRPSLRFHEINVHKQCQPCNTHLHGNIVHYRIELIKRIGIHAVEWLEGDHEPEKLTIPQLEEIRNYYRKIMK